jgi:hypothetical protein
VAGDLVESFWFTQPSTRIWKHKQAVTYNPYKHKTFVDRRTGKPVTEAKHVLIQDREVTIGEYYP